MSLPAADRRADPPRHPVLAEHLSPWIRERERSILREMVAVVSRPGVLSLAGGLPDPALFPAAEVSQALARVLADDSRALQYSPPFAPLREQIVDLMAARGVECSAEQVFVTTGAQQGIDVMTRLLLGPGEEVMLEELSYTGVHQTIAPFEPSVWTVPSDLDRGLDVDTVEERLQAGVRPAFVYVIPDAHNPLGTSMAPENRQRLVELAYEHDVIVLEDDPYGRLAYDGEFASPLRALDDQRVVYLGSFSKILAPGLRLGWMLVPSALVPKVSVAKEASDLETSGLTQRAVSELLSTGMLDGHLERLRTVYRERRDALLAALETSFPEEARWTRPGGGMFVWVELGAGVDTVELLRRCLEQERVAFIPGRAFAAPTAHRASRSELPGGGALRLSFSNLEPATIELAVAKIADCLRRFRDER